MKKITLMFALVLGISATQAAVCPDSITITSDSIAFHYTSSSMPHPTNLASITYLTENNGTINGQLYTPSASSHSFTSTTITVPRPSTINGSTVIKQINYIKVNGNSNQTCNGSTTVPVELLYFEATSLNNVVTLEWATASEDNNSHFEVQKSYDAKTFEAIGVVDGAGHSQSILEYAYTDFERTTAYYRLMQVDFDGAYEYFDVVVVESLSEEVASVVEVSIGVYNLKVTTYKSGEVKKEIVNK